MVNAIARYSRRLLDISKYVDAAFEEYFFRDVSGGHDSGRVPAAENTRADGIVIGTVFTEGRIGCMAGSGSAVSVLVLLDMNEMPVEVGYEYGYRRSVRMIRIARVFNSVRRVNARIDDWKVGFFSRRGEFVGPGFA